MIRAQPRPGWSRKTILGLSASLMLLGLGREARPDVIEFTGNVAHDFPTSPDTTVIPGVAGSVAEAPYIIQNGWTSGFIVESLRVSYDKASDTLFVGVQTYSIAGDADGNPNPNGPDPKLAAAGGVNAPNFGSDKSLTVAFANASPGGGVGSTAFVAGIPADKAVGNAQNANDFTVSTYDNTGRGLAYSYGTILTNHVGQLEVSPTASQPNFEFAITNFSKIPGFNVGTGFYISLFMGSQQAIVVGKEALGWAMVKIPVPEPGGISANSGTTVSPRPPQPASGTQAVPEPGSIALFLVGAVALLGVSRRRRPA